MCKQSIAFLFIVMVGLWLPVACDADTITRESHIQTGAEQTSLYFPLLKDKNVGVVVNHTSVVGDVHLVDTLLRSGIRVQKIFAPEHGFRGTAGAGDKINDSTDGKTGIPIVSLYGSSFKPSPESLRGIDIMIYDIQDVGVRFYTYISTMHYVMESCAEQGIPVIVFDRPNPLGHYIDGPVLKKKYSSFVGLHPIPVVYGMTCGELAQMINMEGWLKDSVKCDLMIIPCNNYDHSKFYSLAINPSPNLNCMESIYLYPSVCFFEGTIMSLGRGTAYPFRLIGHPEYPDSAFSFVPVSNSANKNPLFKDKICYGIDLSHFITDSLKNLRNINPDWLIETYSKMNRGDRFFTNYFDKLAGSDTFRKMIISGKTSQEIKESWQSELDSFNIIRKKYLLYKDFE